MAYTITLTNGSTLIPGGLSDGSIDQAHTSLTLIGRDYAGYGQFLNENFVQLTENFANTSSPANPLKGQLWWDTKDNILKVYTGNTQNGNSGWKVSTGATASPSAPTDLSALGGDLWFDSINSQLKVYNGLGTGGTNNDGWIVVGPYTTAATGNTGIFPALMTDTSGGNHVVLQITIGQGGINSSSVYAIISTDLFRSQLNGFNLVKPGINFSTVATSPWGISIQDTNATANTIVQRDPSGGITVNNITAQAVTASSYSLNGGSFTGNLIGNVSAPIVSAGSITAPSITATAGFSGTMLTANQYNISNIGTLAQLNVNGTTNLIGTATLNGTAIATVGGSASFTAINSTIIGNLTPATGAFTTLQATSIGTITPGTYTFTTGNVAAVQAKAIGNITPGTGAFTTLTASAVNAPIIGNVGAVITGNIGTSYQPAITGVGIINSGTWQGATILPQWGGTGVNNGSNTLTLSGSYTLNQRTDSGAAPTFVGTNFSGIPNGALANSNVIINNTTVSLGGNVTINPTSSQITTALGYTPYSNSNPNNYINSVPSSAVGSTQTNGNFTIFNGGTVSTPSLASFTVGSSGIFMISIWGQHNISVLPNNNTNNGPAEPFSVQSNFQLTLSNSSSSVYWQDTMTFTGSTNYKPYTTGAFGTAAVFQKVDPWSATILLSLPADTYTLTATSAGAYANYQSNNYTYYSFNLEAFGSSNFNYIKLGA
jgi:hypothetical protein